MAEIAGIAGLVVGLLALAGSVFVLLRSVPEQLQKKTDAAMARADQALRGVDDVQNERRKFVLEVQGLLDALEDVQESIEKKRRRIAASDSRKNREEANLPAPSPLDLDRDGQIAYFRQQTFGG